MALIMLVTNMIRANSEGGRIAYGDAAAVHGLSNVVHNEQQQEHLVLRVTPAEQHARRARC